MVTIKKKEDIEILREGGKIHARILNDIAKKAKPGVSTDFLNDMANRLIKEAGGLPSFLDYKPYGAERSYPASLCVSINDEIVHGVSNENPKVLKDGDVVSLDLGLTHKKMITDAAVTVIAGEGSKEAKKLLEVTRNALYVGIKEARGGNHTGDIGFAIESFVKPYGFGIVRELAGHGVGYKVHEDPYVPNFGSRGSGELLRSGMVIAIEPMLNLGTAKIKLGEDGYTYKTLDGKISCHFEHTVLITDGEPEILTEA